MVRIFTRKVKQEASSVDSKKTWHKILTQKLSSSDTLFIPARYRPKRVIYFTASNILGSLYPLNNERHAFRGDSHIFQRRLSGHSTQTFLVRGYTIKQVADECKSLLLQHCKFSWGRFQPANCVEKTLLHFGSPQNDHASATGWCHVSCHLLSPHHFIIVEENDM